MGDLGKLNSLKCNNCKHALSIPPIVYTDSTGIICGRCKDLPFKQQSNPIIHRQVIFETMAKDLVFPCKYHDNGCSVKLKWDEVEEHEKSCSHGKISCMYKLHEFNKSHNVTCEWQGHIDEFFKHVDIHHLNYIDKVEVTLVEKFENKFLFKKLFNDIILVVFLYDKPDNVNIYVMNSCIDNNLEYRVRIFDAEKNASVILPKKISSSLPYTTENVTKYGQKIQLSNIRSILIPKYISIDFESDVMVNSSICSDQSEFDNIKKSKGKYLCSKCKRMLILPVYSCDSSHNFCNTCFENVNVTRSVRYCPIYHGFQASLKINHQLGQELLMNKQICDYTKCSYIAPIIQFALHREICPFRPAKCPACNWTGNDLISHFPKQHTIKNLDQYHIFSNGPFYFIFDGNVFVLQTKSVEPFGFKLVCSNGVEYRYKYNIEITSLEATHKHKGISVFALAEPEIKQIFTKSENDVEEFILYHDIKKNHLSGAISFKLNISRI